MLLALMPAIVVKFPPTKTVPGASLLPHIVSMCPPGPVAFSCVIVPFGERSTTVEPLGLYVFEALSEDEEDDQISNPAKLPATPTEPNASKSIDGNDEEEDVVGAAAAAATVVGADVPNTAAASMLSVAMA